MKIISGKLKGRVIKGFDIEGTRPTMDRVKESLFSSIQDYIPDAVCLDLFAGSGNLGFEAISNGCKYCYFNDHNIKCCNLIKNNIKDFKIEDFSKVFNFDYKKMLNYLVENNIKLDVIFLDPPYKFDKLNEIADFIHNNNLLNKKGIIIFEVDNLYIDIDYYEKIKEKKYGDKYIIIYKNNL